MATQDKEVNPASIPPLTYRDPMLYWDKFSWAVYTQININR